MIGLPGIQTLKMSEDAVRVAIERHLAHELVVGVRVTAIDRDQYGGWEVKLTTDHNPAEDAP